MVEDKIMWEIVENIAWIVFLMGLGAVIIVLLGVALVWVCREDL